MWPAAPTVFAFYVKHDFFTLVFAFGMPAGATSWSILVKKRRKSLKVHQRQFPVAESCDMGANNAGWFFPAPCLVKAPPIAILFNSFRGWGGVPWNFSADFPNGTTSRGKVGGDPGDVMHARSMAF